MKKLLVEYRDIRDKLLAAEMELDLLEKDLGKVSSDIINYKNIERELKYNISFLKKEARIVIATEYRKSIKQLEEIQSKIIKMASEKSKINVKIQQQTDSQEFYFEQFERLFNILEQDQVILYFRGKNEKNNEDCGDEYADQNEEGRE